MSGGQLFLSGGGSEEDSFQLDEEFVKLLNGKLLYIPIAINENKHPYSECLKWIKGVFQKFNFYNIEMWTDIQEKTVSDLKKFVAVYIGGGNTFSLLKEFKDANFDKLLVEFYKQGGHIYGGSAGAIILGKNISTAFKDDKNEVNLNDLHGLNLVEDYSIWCHYNESDNPGIKALLNDDFKILALPEDTGLIVKENEIIKIGRVKEFFN